MRILTKVEFETPEFCTGLESFKEIMDTVVGNTFAVPNPKFKMLKSVVAQTLTKLFEPAVMDLLTPPQVDIKFVKMFEFMKRIAEMAE